MIGFRATYSDGTVYHFVFSGPNYKAMSPRAVWLTVLRKALDACPRWAALCSLEEE